MIIIVNILMKEKIIIKKWGCRRIWRGKRGRRWWRREKDKSQTIMRSKDDIRKFIGLNY